jgi:endonuclease-3 related protein
MGGVNDLSSHLQQPEVVGSYESAMLTDLHLLHEVYSLLLDHFGPQHWWPADTPDEILAGCVLAQNTRWERIVPVIEILSGMDLLSPARLAEIPLRKLALLLRGSGTFRRKADYLKGLAVFFHERGWPGESESLSSLDTPSLRRELLGLKGIGPETADCILLYVLERPVFVVDAYTRRILNRHSLCGADESYEELQGLFHTALNPDPVLFNEYHALLVMCGKVYCRPKPQCDACPLACLFVE